ncbi:MAG: DUF2167 domain-containing protein [Phycisphaerales bacterium]|nr:DUF2167 domain-containing protein [Phycisphaerales bacterium]MCB9854393.1 DUF2167 domain-containing protein [Phycisphaerales bacterium]MCB9863594.1 DUF2167 domain-containing protein [Phycisphaerales bacterium]
MNDARNQRTRIGALLPRICWIVTLAGMLTGPQVIRAEGEGEDNGPQPPSVSWIDGPSMGQLGSLAELKVPELYRFAGANDTRQIMEFYHNPTDGSELGYIEPANPFASWYVVFEFDDMGYVKDDDKDDLDPVAMLESIKRGNEAANKIRERNGWGKIEVIGWEQEPHYDETTQNLVWATLARSEGGLGVNYNMRVLGRAGVMRVTLVCDQSQLKTIVPQFNTLMQGFSYVPGQKYSEFRSGDKIAEYGLTALVTGGAVAVAAKSGLLKYLWKLIVVVVVGIGAAFKKLFGGGKSSTT